MTYKYRKDEILTDLAQIEAKLSEYNIIVAVDGSGSMGEPAKAADPRGQTRWQAVQEFAMDIARDAEKIDDDGIGLVFFAGASAVGVDNVTSQNLREIFSQRSPRGSTPLYEGIVEILKLAQGSQKKVLAVVFTDGLPNDRTKVANIIKEISNLQPSDDAFTFLFIQVGDDPGATQYLQSLDNEIKGAKYDIVDTKTVMEAEKFPTTAELLYNAIID